MLENMLKSDIIEGCTKWLRFISNGLFKQLEKSLDSLTLSFACLTNLAIFGQRFGSLDV